MNSEVYRKEYTFHDPGIRRRDFQYGNRNNCRRPSACEERIFRHGFREIPKSNKTWFQGRRWPSAESPSAVPYYSPGRQQTPFIPNYHFEPYFRIPTFWGLRFPDVFRFHNSSKNTVQFPSATSGKLPRSSSRFAENKGTRNNAMKSSESGINDVEYLYTVQLKGGELVEVVDLSEDSNVPSNSNESRISNPHLSSMARESVNGNGIQKKPEKETSVIPRKTDDVRKKGRKRKKSSEDILCDICESDYKFIRSKGEDIYKSRCGHMFCQSCLTGLNPYKCPECNIFFQKLLKVLY